MTALQEWQSGTNPKRKKKAKQGSATVKSARQHAFSHHSRAPGRQQSLVLDTNLDLLQRARKAQRSLRAAELSWDFA